MIQPTRVQGDEAEAVPAKRSRKRVAALAAATSVGLAVALVMVAVPIVRSRVRREIETRCGRALGGTCAVGSLSLDTQGAHAQSVRAQTASGALSAEIDSIDVNLRWMPLLLDRPQGIVVRVSHPALTDQAPLDHVINEVLVLHGLHSGELLPRHAHMQRFEVIEGSLRVPIAPFVGGRVEGIALQTERDGRLDLRWRDAAVDAGPFHALNSGACTVTRPAGTRMATLDCPHTHETIDLDALASNAGMTSIALRVLRSAVGRIPGLP